MSVCVCVCERERESKGEEKGMWKGVLMENWRGRKGGSHPKRSDNETGWPSKVCLLVQTARWMSTYIFSVLMALPTPTPLLFSPYFISLLPKVLAGLAGAAVQQARLDLAAKCEEVWMCVCVCVCV